MNPGARKSSALRLGNLVEAVLSYLLLVCDVYIRERSQLGHAPVRVLPDDAAALAADECGPEPVTAARGA
jgi:hypothetical protein